jgi:hypothetical protein
MNKNLHFTLCAVAACALAFTGCAADEPSTDETTTDAAANTAADANETAADGTNAAGEDGASDGATPGTPSDSSTTGSAAAADTPVADPLVCEDTAALPAAAIENDMGPGTRITSIEVPTTPAEAADLGCRTVGTNNGSGLGGVLTLVQQQGEFDGLDALLMTDGDEAPDLILLGQLVGWEADQTASAATAALHMYTGEMGEPNVFSIDPESLIDGDVTTPQLAFDTDLSNGCLMASAPVFDIRLPIEAIGEIALSLSAAKTEGHLNVNQDGFGIENGTITGYLTEEGVGALVENIIALCDTPDAPSFCGTVNSLLMGDVMLGTEVILGFLGNSDSTVNADQTVTAGCDKDTLADGAACAVSICLGISSTPTKIAGVAAAE